MGRRLDTWCDTTLSRRALLIKGGTALCGLPLLGLEGSGAGRRLTRFEAPPFGLGVSSGDPTNDGVVLWTRVLGAGMDPAELAQSRVDVTWEIADDERLSKVVKRGVATAAPEWGHSIHVEANGLDADRWYWYRFRAGDAFSSTGRTRTLPRAGQAATQLRFAFCSCQHYEQGLFTPYRHMSEEDLDLIFHLGDYIYEGPGAANRVRQHAGTELLTLDDYRKRYAQYRTDPDLQAAHAACPWFVTWDDHEVDNNYANAVSERDDPREIFLMRRAAAYQAYYENMPLRRSSMPQGPSMRLYRGFSYGTLSSFFVLDTRQYRSNQPCGDGRKAPCPEVFDPKATLLGPEQERWLFQQLDRSRTRWNMLPQQVMMARVDQTGGPEESYSMDQWSGYDADRTRVLEFLAKRRPSNPVVLTGDIHSNWVNDLKVDFRDRASPIVATELVGTSISSGGDGVDVQPRTPEILAENPFVKFYNSQRGYVSCELTPTSLSARYRIVDYVSRAGAPKRTRASFVVEDGKPGAVRV
ncbi:MAG TPA: alkaline phosphatase D family protein [Vicinamibacterales bacterium]|nr:alkaline phosphatase D family protein [Vicinamibacterales bacterium]